MSDPQRFSLNLTPIQKRLITTALALAAAVVILGILFGAFLLLRIFVTTFASVLWPLATAGILALILKPFVTWAQRALKLGRIKSIILLYLLVVLVMGGILAFFVPVLIDQTTSFIQRAPTIWENLRSEVTTRFPQIQAFIQQQIGEERLIQYQQALNEQADKVFELMLPAAQDFFEKLTAVLAVGTGLAIVPVYLFFFLLSDHDPTKDLDDHLSFIKDEWREDLLFLIREFAGSMVAFFRGQIVIGIIMGILMAIGFSIAGVNFGIGLGLLIGALNVIPYLGTIIGLGSVLPIAYFQPDGGLTLMLIALAIFIAVQMLEGYVLTPRIMGKQTGLHPLTIIIAIFFWGTALDGLLGMILAIPLTAFFVVAWRLLNKKYLDRWLKPQVLNEE